MSTLVFNAGSSSLRFSVFDEELNCIYKGHVDAIGQKNCAYHSEKSPQSLKISCKSITEAVNLSFKKMEEQLPSQSLATIRYVGHRVVHGGTAFKQAVRLTPKVLRQIEKLSPLAPLHNPINCEAIHAAQKKLPKAVHLAVFDTAFHAEIPEVNSLYALPLALAQKKGWKRYGFHGISHEYLSLEAKKILKKASRERSPSKLITCHIGNGVSLCAIKNGKSIDTTMGFTPLEGPCMGTRSGTIDPGLVLELCKDLGIAQTEHLLLKESGLKGLSEKSSDVRVLRTKPQSKNSQRALAIMAQQIAKQLSALFASLEGLPDAIIFSAGIGEHAPYLRKAILKPFAALGVQIDATANQKNALFFHTKKSTIKLLVIPAQEELQIAREVQSARKL